MYKILITTASNNLIADTDHSLEFLISKGDSHSTCQGYEIVDMDTEEIVVRHHNLPAMMVKQAGGTIG